MVAVFIIKKSLMTIGMLVAATLALLGLALCAIYTAAPLIRALGETTLLAVDDAIIVTIWFFFLQAEDGIRYGHVTGVQTCALPILKIRPIAFVLPTISPKKSQNMSRIFFGRDIFFYDTRNWNRGFSRTLQIFTEYLC